MKKKLELEEEKAKEIYKISPPEFQAVLIDTFGQEFFREKITDRIKTFEDACCAVGKISDEVMFLLGYKGCNRDFLSSQAHAKLVIITRALNQGWTPDWDNTTEYKWYPWFRLGSGFGFSASGTDSWYSSSHIGSRLCFKSEELAKYAGKQFESIYEKLLN